MECILSFIALNCFYLHQKVSIQPTVTYDSIWLWLIMLVRSAEFDLNHDMTQSGTSLTWFSWIRLKWIPSFPLGSAKLKSGQIHLQGPVLGSFTTDAGTVIEFWRMRIGPFCFKKSRHGLVLKFDRTADCKSLKISRDRDYFVAATMFFDLCMPSHRFVAVFDPNHIW